MNEQPNSVPASPAPDIPALAPNPAPVVPVNVGAAPVNPGNVSPAPVSANPAPVAPESFAPVTVASVAPNPATMTAAPVTPNPAPVAVEPDYRAMYENLRRENEILRQNAETAQRSPVQGVTGGGVVTVPNDDFLRGFDSDTW